MLNFLNSGSLPPGANDSKLIVIPKVQYPETLGHLRPISLCNINYKVITKTISNRLKKIMDSVIGPNQSSFVPGCQITDNIVIYQEVLHSTRIKKTCKGIMTIKIDLEKAYDRLS